jgi:hypothetical protein
VTPAAGRRRRPAALARRGERGQATVELTLALPVVVLGLLLIVQVGVVVRAQVLVVHAAREAARAAAVGEPLPALDGLDPARTDVGVAGSGEVGGRVRVIVTYRCRTDMPLVGALVPDVEVRGSATMRVE